MNIVLISSSVITLLIWKTSLLTLGGRVEGYPQESGHPAYSGNTTHRRVGGDMLVEDDVEVF